MLTSVWYFFIVRISVGEGFSYTLNQVALKPNQELTLSSEGRTLFFKISFRSGSGNFEKAELIKQGNIYKVVLNDTNNKLENMIVSYDLSGKINDIVEGKYVLQIVNGNKTEEAEILAENQFRI